MSKIEMFLTAKNDTEGFPLPVLPPDINKVLEAELEHFKIQNGKVTTLNASPDPVEISFESFFPSSTGAYFRTDGLSNPPSYYVDLINSWVEDGTPVRFLFVGGSLEINLLTKISNFEVWQEGADFDVHYSLDLMEYNREVLKKVEIKKAKKDEEGKTIQKDKVVTNNKPPREEGASRPRTYALRAGDNLYAVARKYTGSGERYKEIQRLNNIKDSDLRRLPIGLKLKIPDSW